MKLKKVIAKLKANQLNLLLLGGAALLAFYFLRQRSGSAAYAEQLVASQAPPVPMGANSAMLTTGFTPGQRVVAPPSTSVFAGQPLVKRSVGTLR